MNLSLYQISADIAAILSREEWDEETEAALAALEMALEVKADNCAAFIGNLESFVEYAKAEEKRISEKRKAAENRVKRIKEYLMANMKAVERTSIEVGTRKIAIQKNPAALKIDDEAQIPARFWTIIPETKVVNNADLKEALKRGEDVPGAHLEQGESLRIR